jgi:hypothetical protein
MKKKKFIIIEKNASVLRPSHALTRSAFLHHASLSFLFPHRSMYSSSLISDKTDPVVMRAAQRRYVSNTRDAVYSG